MCKTFLQTAQFALRVSTLCKVSDLHGAGHPPPQEPGARDFGEGGGKGRLTLPNPSSTPPGWADPKP